MGSRGTDGVCGMGVPFIGRRGTDGELESSVGCCVLRLWLIRWLYEWYSCDSLGLRLQWNFYSKKKYPCNLNNCGCADFSMCLMGVFCAKLAMAKMVISQIGLYHKMTPNESITYFRCEPPFSSVKSAYEWNRSPNVFDTNIINNWWNTMLVNGVITNYGRFCIKHI